MAIYLYCASMTEHWFLNFFCLSILEEFDLLLSLSVVHYDSDSQLELGIEHFLGGQS